MLDNKGLAPLVLPKKRDKFLSMIAQETVNILSIKLFKNIITHHDPINFEQLRS